MAKDEYVLAYMPHSGIYHLTEPGKFRTGFGAETNPICGARLMSPVALDYAPKQYRLCGMCEQVQILEENG